MRTFEEIRVRQARRLFRAIDPRRKPWPNFSEFLSEVPPLRPGVGDPTFFDRPVLVDRCVSIPRFCNGLKVGRISPHVQFNNRYHPTRPMVYWIWCHDGSRRLGMTPENCFDAFGPDEFGLGDLEGLAFHTQYPTVARNRFIDLPGSFFAEDTSQVACLGPWNGYRGRKVWLHHINEKVCHPRCGSGSYCLSQDTDPS